jgi:hypothetical protein
MSGIVPVFDPTTGASGGPAAGGGGGTSLLDMGSPIDLTDGSWSLYDPVSMIKSTAFAGGKMTITFNAVAPSGGHVINTNNAVADFPRWYRAVEIDGTAMDTDSLLTQLVALTPDQTVREFNSAFLIGLATGPAIDTVRATILGQGAYCELGTGTINPSVGCWGLTSTTKTGTGNATVTGNYSALYGGRKGGPQGMMALDSGGLFLQAAARTYTGTLAAAATIYEIVAVAPRDASGGGGTITDGEKMAFTATSSIIRQA